MSDLKQSEDLESWDLVIEPQSSLFDLKLRQVWRYRDLLLLFVKRDFISFYKQTILGPIWFFIQPIFTTATYVFVFGRLAGISTDGVPMPLFYLTGITAWTYFSDCLLKTSTVFTDNAGIFGKVYFPRLVMPLSIVISNLVRFGVQLTLLMLVMIYYVIGGLEFHFNGYTLLFPLFIVLMAAQGLGLGMIVSAMTTKYRDLAFLLRFGIQLLMYMTTVVYPLSTLSGQMKTLIGANPMTSVIEGIRLGLLGTGSFDLQTLGYLVLVTSGILVLGTVVYNKVEKSFVDTI
jgi:lipopolysaccharide transport system permease protein